MQPWVWIAFGVFAVLFIVTTFLRLRRGGPGPGISGWIPRSMRGRMNDSYEKHGWRQPYDDDGNLNRDNNRLL